MNSHVQEAIHQIINTLHTYTHAMQGYNEVAAHGATEWVEQRKAYECWTELNQSYINYLSEVNLLTQSLTGEVMVPVAPLSIVGIGILGIGVIYINSGSGIMTGNATHPFHESVDTIHNATGMVMHVGGLPDGTIIYTSTGTYSIQNGQAINLMV